ncbi:2-succinyl-5-enolpyruvyl-6-hydroxy-3-cyclohexene-1-carboxylic-acid synthase [Algoriphagus formosus]|uniref:2-succinyl-5-enolpyruvyl-6-hydroxy-3- cyclohexene-1-carboxylic-acid synthase n=1 Tax=Algoriphagus formosus TaxID=2007308 RepID=UPI001E37138B|nr:2-succinyl-5-enolpyruvyl-6-hydroxy-3-cyclohexene-1-carboxylic-acid synthase [Algoriphagus formosus]
MQAIVDLVAICAKKGIRHAILSPGSRCAPLTLAFARNPEIQTRTISDERSAAFIALGMAQQLKQPVVLVCTSGSATLNYFPAVSEAFFQEIPLLILTADRPPEWIDQWDGQTIHQTKVYGKHVKESFDFPDSFEHQDQLWYAQRVVNEAINLSMSGPKGPVHINIPLREPFYPKKGESFSASAKLPVIQVREGKRSLANEDLDALKSKLNTFKKILIIPGQQNPDPTISEILQKLSKEQHLVVVADTISNHQIPGSVTLHDHWMGNESISKDLVPDLVISFGKSVISKSLKLFLRKNEVEHWHIQANQGLRDPFQGLTEFLDCDAIFFLKWLSEQGFSSDKAFQEKWLGLEDKVNTSLFNLLDQEDFGEYPAFKKVLEHIPANSQIQVANSMAVRYLNFLGKRPQEIYCNRGTSGIDGSNSTAVGAAWVSDGLVTLITGDLAFFYDRNAFWNNYPSPNLRIILLNNHAGGIFRLIEGPSQQPELEEYFETEQTLDASYLAKEQGFDYALARDSKELEAYLQDFYLESSQPKILEIESESGKNAQILRRIKNRITEELL